MTLVTVDPRARSIGDTTPALIGRLAPNLRLVAALPTNKSGPVALAYRNVIHDPLGHPLGDSDGIVIGQTLWVHRLSYAQRRGPMAVSKRYSPEKDPGESCVFGMNFDAVIPRGSIVTSAVLDIFTNAATPAAADSAWSKGAVQVHDRTVYATLGGGADGTDYILRWTATDSDGNIWPRSALILCAKTS